MVEDVVQSAVTQGGQEMATSGLMDQIKEAPEKLAKKFEFTKEKALELSIYLVGGFLLGFMLKRYNRVVVTVIVVILVLLTLEYFHLIDLNVHWEKVRQLIGMNPMPKVDGTVFSTVWEWAKEHLAQVICFTIGFLAGLKLG